jgi:acyl-CoA thioesterase-2
MTTSEDLPPITTRYDDPDFPPGPGVEGDLLQLLELEQLEVDLYRAPFVFKEKFALYGGQVAAQALRAAALTVGSDRVPHSLHGYFLRAGQAAQPVVFQVFRDRDGRSYSSRRVVAIQNGEVLFNMATSFHVAEDGPDNQLPAVPEVPDPERLERYLPPRLFSIEARVPEQPYDDLRAPVRIWARSTIEIGADPLLQACAITYLSDIGTGMDALLTPDVAWQSSLDHALWFHRPISLDDWVLMDLVPLTSSNGRGFYTGAMYDRERRLCVSITQETLFRYKKGHPA